MSLPVATMVAGASVILFENEITALIFGARKRFCRSVGGLCLAFCFGVVLGLVAAERVPSGVNLGFASSRIERIVARVVVDPRTSSSGGYYTTVELIEAEAGNGCKVSANGRLLVFFRTSGGVGERGCIVSFEGSIVEGHGGPIFQARRTELLERAPTLERLRGETMGVALRRFQKVSWGGLASALLLGVRDNLDDGDSERYARAGCAHVLSLSGMHLAVISALISLALKRFLGLRPAAVVGTLTVVLYVAFVGFYPSLLRSLIMYSLGAIAVINGLPRRVPPLLATAFLVQLCIDPIAARSLSFVLSYLALAGIAVLGSAMDDLLRGILPTFIRAPFAATFGAFVATSAISASAFGSLKPIGLVSSLVVAPISSVFMIGSLFWFVCDCVAPPISAILDVPLHLLAALDDSAVDVFARSPALVLPSATPVLYVSLAISALLVYGRYRLNETRNRVEPFD